MMNYSKWDKIDVSDSDSDEIVSVSGLTTQFYSVVNIDGGHRAAQQEGEKERAAGQKLRGPHARKGYKENSAQTLEQQEKLREHAELIAAQLIAEEEAEKRASARAKDKKKKKKPHAGNALPSKDPFHQTSAARDPSDSLATQEHPARCAERDSQRDESHRTTGVEPEFLWNTVSKPKGQTRVQHEFDLAGWKTSKCFLEERSLGCFCVARVSCCDGL